ncbi:hypothetical protein [Marinimicrobium sp. LS-A18]|uniref:hypothetical protein n=1 Tax=Marinimicrobium sp. LS-A18 TaxID=1381596 RepID=UPI001268A3ED|nr:hypothetical protein [Marinimicrobium sp. LS-A18]
MARFPPLTTPAPKRRGATPLTLLLGGWLMLSGAHAIAQADARLAPSKIDGFFQPREPLRITLAADALPADPGQLSLELDGMDVSALAQRRTEGWVYVPVRPLAPGHHELRLMFYGNQGEVQELGYWSVEVRHSSGLRSAHVDGQLDLALSQRVAESEGIGGDDFRAQGGGHLESELSGDRWTLSSNLDLMAVNDRALAIADRRVDLARFQLRGEFDRYHLALGDQQLTAASLIQDGFERRGVSTGAKLPLWDGTASIYQAASRQTVGVDAGLGTDEENNRMTGGRLTFWPWRSDTTQVMLAGEHLSGRVSQPDYGSLDPNADPLVHEGDAWNLTLDGLFFQRQLRVRLEQAESEYDFDGMYQGFDPEQGDAWSALLVLDPTVSGTDALDWRLGLEARKMGTWFRSLANRHAPADKKLERAFFDATKDKWTWDGHYAVEQSNLTEDDRYAISETRQWQLGTAYFDYDLPENTLLTLLGQPTYSLNLGGTTLKDDYTPQGYLANDLKTRRAELTAAFSKEQLQWSAAIHYDTLEDGTDWQPDNRTRATRLDAGWYLNSDYNFYIGWELQHTTYPEQNLSTDRHIYSFDANATFVPERLAGSFSMGLNQTSARDDPFYAQWDQTTYLNANLNWRLREAEGHRPGVELILSIARNDYRDQLVLPNSVNSYQAFIELRTHLPVTYPGIQP